MGFVEHPSSPASRLPGARACAARERRARHTLAAGGRRAVGTFHFKFVVSFSSLLPPVSFHPDWTAMSGRGGERRAGKDADAIRRYVIAFKRSFQSFSPSG